MNGRSPCCTLHLKSQALHVVALLVPLPPVIMTAAAADQPVAAAVPAVQAGAEAAGGAGKHYSTANCNGSRWALHG